MRADRLIQVLLLLQGRPRVTAAEVAKEVEVSVATARRDLEALAMAGVPIYPQQGRGGGWALVGGARTDLTGLTEPEALAVMRLASTMDGRSGDERAAIAKLLRALPATFREGAGIAAESMLVDRTAWGVEIPEPPASLPALQEAIVRTRRLRIRYLARADAEPRDRVVDPWGLVDKIGVWYLVAGTERGRRTYRADRMLEVEPTGERFERPSDARLGDAWREVVDEVEQRRSATSATVEIAERLVGILQGQLGRHCTVLEVVDDVARARVTAPTPVDIARNLAGWGGLVTVVEPATVRAELRAIGAELVAADGR